MNTLLKLRLPVTMPLAMEATAPLTPAHAAAPSTVLPVASEMEAPMPLAAPAVSRPAPTPTITGIAFSMKSWWTTRFSRGVTKPIAGSKKTISVLYSSGGFARSICASAPSAESALAQ